MFVCDTNLIMYLLIQGPHTFLARRVFDERSYPVVPLFWRAEFLKVVCTYVRQKLMTLSEARQLIVASHGLLLIEEDPKPDLVLALAQQSGCSGYDCLFVALAVEHHLPLATLDKKLLGKFPGVAIHPSALLD